MRKLFATLLIAVAIFGVSFATPDTCSAYTREQIEVSVDKAAMSPLKMLFVAETDIEMVHEVLAEKGKTIVQEVKMKDQNNNFWFRIRFN